MKNIFACSFILTIFVQPVTAFAVDYSDFDSFCHAQLKSELELIKNDAEEGLLTKTEAAEEIDYLPKVEQCVCYYEKALEGTGAEFTLYLQKRAEIEMESDEDYVYEKIAKMKMPKYPEGMDISAFMNNIEKACGLYSD